MNGYLILFKDHRGGEFLTCPSIGRQRAGLFFALLKKKTKLFVHANQFRFLEKYFILSNFILARMLYIYGEEKGGNI